MKGANNSLTDSDNDFFRHSLTDGRRQIPAGFMPTEHGLDRVIISPDGYILTNNHVVNNASN
jgi:S1-C subfamily serine protease